MFPPPIGAGRCRGPVCDRRLRIAAVELRDDRPGGRVGDRALRFRQQAVILCVCRLSGTAGCRRAGLLHDAAFLLARGTRFSGVPVEEILQVRRQGLLWLRFVRLSRLFLRRKAFGRGRGSIAGIAWRKGRRVLDLALLGAGLIFFSTPRRSRLRNIQAAFLFGAGRFDHRQIGVALPARHAENFVVDSRPVPPLLRIVAPNLVLGARLTGSASPRPWRQHRLRAAGHAPPEKPGGGQSSAELGHPCGRQNALPVGGVAVWFSTL